MENKVTHYMSTIKVSPKGQIVIPKEIRDMFDIKTGDSLIMMADSEKGIAIQKQSVMEQIAKAIFEGNGKSVSPKEEEQDFSCFADAITEAMEKGASKK